MTAKSKLLIVWGIGAILRFFAVQAGDLSWEEFSDRIRRDGKVDFPLSTFAEAPRANDSTFSTNRLRQWTADDGLPQADVHCLLQSRGGYLWVGTMGGLVRFDGKAFVPVPLNPLRSVFCLALAEDPSGAIWVGTTDGLARLAGNNVTTLTTQDGLLDNRIEALWSSPSGAIWIGTGRGLNIWLQDKLTAPELKGRDKHEREILSFHQERKDRLWIVGGNVGYVDPRSADGQALNYHTIPDLPVSQARRVASDPSGSLWFGGKEEMWRWKEGGAAMLVSRDNVWALAADSTGNVVVGTDAGVNLYSQSATLLLQHDRRVSSLLYDGHGDLWIGGVSGLFEIPNTPLRPVPAVVSDGDLDTWSIYAARDGTVWVGTEGGLRAIRDGISRRYSFWKPSWPPTYGITCIGESTGGEIWAGNRNGFLFRLYDRLEGEFRKVEIFRFYPEDTGSICSISATSDSGIWLNCERGVLQGLGGQVKNRGKELGLPSVTFLSTFEAHDGTVWFGTDKNGLFCLEKNGLRASRPPESLSSDGAVVRVEDELGAFWILRRRGLSRLKNGRLSNIASGQGLYSENILDMLDDGSGNYWFSSLQGIFRTSKSELNEVADGTKASLQCVVYGLPDGAPSLEGNATGLPNSCRDNNGMLWFPTTKGPVTVDPKKAAANDEPPGVFIEQVRANTNNLLTQPCHSNSPRVVRIPPGEGRGLVFHYTALEFNAPEKVRFKYRLEGYDADWIEAQSQRVALYAAVPPGSYVFRVKACSRRGVWNEAGAAFAFRLEPFFYQTKSFWISLTAVLISGAGLMVRYRFQTQRRILALEQTASLARERERIARDLHDEFGANLTRVALLTEAARSERNASGLDRLGEMCREMLDGVGELVWATNPKYDDLRSMTAYFRSYSGKFLSETGIACDFSAELDSPNAVVTPEFRRQLFLILKEALNNVAKHSRARKVQVRVLAEGGKLDLRIADDGIGCLCDEKPDFHHGLDNLRARAEMLGGRLSVESALGKGFEVRATVNLSDGER